MATVENVFNQGLALALRSLRPDWHVVHEQTGVLENRQLRPDVLVRMPDEQCVALESAELQRGADDDAKRRLGANTIDTGRPVQCAVSIRIPPELKEIPYSQDVAEALLGGALLHYAMYQAEDEATPRRWPRTGSLDGRIMDLARLAEATAVRRDALERLAVQVCDGIKAAASTLRHELPESELLNVQYRMLQRSPVSAMQTAMLLWLNAILTQRRLHGLDVPEAILPVRSESNSGVLPSDVLSCWKRLLKRNWHSIFQPALVVLQDVADRNARAAASALEKLNHVAEKIETAGIGERLAVGAEIYPKLAEDRKTAAAFYTRPAFAELLAALAIRPGLPADVEWTDVELLRRHTLADLACGTGTLLRAGYRRIKELHHDAICLSFAKSNDRDASASSDGSLSDAGRFHKAGMESGIVGGDISAIAAHLTTTSLAALGGADEYGDTRICFVEVGGETSATGTLEFFAGSEIPRMLVGSRTQGVSRGRKSEHREILELPDSSVDWILMNPPYSRTRGGQSVFDVAGLSDNERADCQRRWKELVQNEPAHKINRTSGLAASFLGLAIKKLKKGGGLGFVLPLSAAAAPSWKGTRQYLEATCTNIVAIGTRAGRLREQSISADTGMQEMLLVAQKRAGAPGRKTGEIMKQSTLHEPVESLGVAGEIARAMQASIDKVGKAGDVSSVLCGGIAIGHVIGCAVDGCGAPWDMVGTVSPDAAIAANRLASEGVLYFDKQVRWLPAGMTTIGKLFEVGPTHHIIGHLQGRDATGALTMHNIDDPASAHAPVRSLWAADARSQTSMRVCPTHWGIECIEKPPKEKQLALVLPSSGHLHYARGMRWTSQSVLAATTMDSVLGGRAWTTLRHVDPSVRASFALWANSTLGFLVHWTRGQRTHHGRSTTQVRAIAEMPCPMLDDLPPDDLMQALRDFEDLQERKLKPACKASEDEARMDIDRAVLRLFGMEDVESAVSRIRKIWCLEPSVNGGSNTSSEHPGNVELDS